MLNKATFYIVPLVQIFGILFLGWNLIEVTVIYGLQLYALGLVTVISLLIPIRRKLPFKFWIAEFVSGLSLIFLLSFSYGLMVFIGSWVIFGLALHTGYIGHDESLSALIKPHILPGLILVVFTEVIKAHEVAVLYYNRKVNLDAKVYRAYIELTVFLIILILFFYLGGVLAATLGESFTISVESWFALVFVLTRTGADLLIERYQLLQKSYDKLKVMNKLSK